MAVIKQKRSGEDRFMGHSFNIRAKFMFIIFIIAALLGGCAFLSQTVEFDPTARERIHTIALLQVVPSNRFIFNDPGLQAEASKGSPIHILLAAAKDKARNEYLTEMTKRGITLCPEMVDAIKMNLIEKGYEITYLDGQRPLLTEDKKTDYSNINTTADAILNVSYQEVGFATFFIGYSPWLVIEVELFDTHTKNILYRKLFNVTGSSMVQALEIKSSHEVIAPGKKYKFNSSPDDLLNKFDLSIEGLLNGQEKVARRIAKHLSKKIKQ